MTVAPIPERLNPTNSIPIVRAPISARTPLQSLGSEPARTPEIAQGLAPSDRLKTVPIMRPVDFSDVVTLKELLGHSNIQTTMIYAHLSDKHKQTAMERMGSVEYMLPNHSF